MDPGRISAPASAAIREARRERNGIGISDITLLELAVAVARGRLQVTMGVEQFLSEIESRFEVLPITGRISALVLGLPTGYPSDAVDRIIGATALAHGAVLVTADRQIRRCKAVPTVW